MSQCLRNLLHIKHIATSQARDHHVNSRLRLRTQSLRQTLDVLRRDSTTAADDVGASLGQRHCFGSEVLRKLTVHDGLTVQLPLTRIWTGDDRHNRGDGDPQGF